MMKMQVANRLSTWSVRGLIRRMFSIIKRYGFTGEPYYRAMDGFVSLTKSFNINPTFPVTATVVDRHGDVFRQFQERGVEFAIHGFRHVDYTILNRKECIEHICKAIDIFNKHHIHYNGFRFPYLRRSEELIEILSEFNFQWESGPIIMWKKSLDTDLTDEQTNSLNRILYSYQPSYSQAASSLPFIHSKIVHIPVSLPDDDILIQRIGLRSCEQIESVWIRILKKTYHKGEMFTLQTHPERFFCYRDALKGLLAYAKSRNVWIASLERVAEWWRERASIQCCIEKIGDETFRLRMKSKRPIHVLYQIGGKKKQLESMYEEKNPSSIVFHNPSEKFPFIGLYNDVPDTVKNFLREEGYLYENIDNGRAYSLYLIGIAMKTNGCIPYIKKIIRESHEPLLKYTRWPHGARSCLAVTGDIDCMDIWDILGRFYE